jgi:predicted site-specific integrase-resolvase
LSAVLISAVVDYDRHVNLKRWAEAQGVSCATARRWFESGELPVPARRDGRLILVGDVESTGTPGVAAVCARVSSAGQEADLDRQVARVTAWAAGEGVAVGRVVTEVGSPLNGRRREFLKLLRDPAVCARMCGNRAARAIAALGRDGPG